MKWKRQEQPFAFTHLSNLKILESAYIEEIHPISKKIVVTRVLGGYIQRVYDVESLHHRVSLNLIATAFVPEDTLT